MRKKLLMSAIAAMSLLIVALAVVFAQGALSADASGKKGNHQTASAVTPNISTVEYATGACTFPWGTALDNAGNLWVACPGQDPTPFFGSATPGKIAVFNIATRKFTKIYTVPAGQPLFLALDGSGNVWYATAKTNQIWRLTPSSNTFKSWNVPTAASGPWGIAVDKSGNVWFTEHYTNKVGKLTPSTGVFKEFKTTAANSQPYGITVDGGNNVWFTENVDSVAKIAKITAAGVLSEYKIRNTATAGSGLTPHLIAADNKGNIWWTEGFAGAIGKLVVAQAVPGTNKGVTELSYPKLTTTGVHTSGISVSGAGVVWFDDSLQNTYGSYNGAFSVTKTPSPGHDHDGVKVDGAGRVFLTEEFGNKLFVRG